MLIIILKSKNYQFNLLIGYRYELFRLLDRLMKFVAQLSSKSRSGDELPELIRVV